MPDDDDSVLNRNLLIIRLEFSHVGKTIEIFWGHKEFSEYMENILSDKRVGKQGFPLEVIEALISLQALHDKIFPQFLPPISFGWTFGKD